MTKLFREDDALRNDPTYPGIKGWWKEYFNRDFFEDWKDAAHTERVNADRFTRLIRIEGVAYEVTSSIDGYSVYKTAEK